MSNVVKSRDRGAKAVEAALKEWAKGEHGVSVGVFGRAAKAKHGNDPETVGEIAAQNELGAGVPRRSFLRDWVEQRKPEIRDAYLALLGDLSNGMAMGRALGRMGLTLENSMRERIRKHIPPPNSPTTVNHKGSSTPLIDSGQLIQSIHSSAKSTSSRRLPR